MPYRADSLGLSGHVTTLLLELIHDRLGLHYTASESDNLADRLAPLVVSRGLASFLDYYYQLKYSPADDDWLNVMDALSIQETYLWREIDQLRTVVDYLVPHLAAAYRGSPLRIWSAACATGEEPLTIAMLLAEAGWFARAPIEIAATDASPSAIARARTGVYGRRSFRNLPEALRDKYFVPQGDRWAVTPELKQRVSYDIVNLMDDSDVRRHAAVPVVVCRNVFIYFSDTSIRRVLSAFEQAMPSPAFLCVGVSESLLRRTSTFELEEIGGAFVYVKGAPSEPSRAWARGIETTS